MFEVKYFKTPLSYRNAGCFLLTKRYIKGYGMSFQEREAALKLFKGKKGQAFLRDMVKRTKTFVPGAGLPAEKKVPAAGAVGGAARPAGATAPNGITENGQNRQDVEAIKVRF